MPKGFTLLNEQQKGAATGLKKALGKTGLGSRVQGFSGLGLRA